MSDDPFLDAFRDALSERQAGKPKPGDRIATDEDTPSIASALGAVIDFEAHAEAWGDGLMAPYATVLFGDTNVPYHVRRARHEKARKEALGAISRKLRKDRRT